MDFHPSREGRLKPEHGWPYQRRATRQDTNSTEMAWYGYIPFLQARNISCPRQRLLCLAASDIEVLYLP